MHAITVAVDYTDFLSATVPLNRHHFKRMTVITDAASAAAVDAAVSRFDVRVYVASAFSAAGSWFNKWGALDEFLDTDGRAGIMCLLDADIVLPGVLHHLQVSTGCLFSPWRRYLVDWKGVIPAETQWGNLPDDVPGLDKMNEWYGSTLFFDGQDPSLPSGHWFSGFTQSAAGGDLRLWNCWPVDRRVRPVFDVLHLGHPRQNWFGRVSAYRNGEFPAGASARAAEMGEAQRRDRRCWKWEK